MQRDAALLEMVRHTPDGVHGRVRPLGALGYQSAPDVLQHGNCDQHHAKHADHRHDNPSFIAIGQQVFRDSGH